MGVVVNRLRIGIFVDTVFNDRERLSAVALVYIK